MEKSAVIAMSGGVDSSVAAAIAMQTCSRAEGVTLKLYREGQQEAEASCCGSKDIEDAARVAQSLGIKHHVLNFSDDFERYVVKYFVDTYLAGGTPNPCVECNRHIKFREILKYASENGFSHIVTGHYARVEYDSVGKRYLLKKALDASKEQSYVLYSLSQQQLAHILLPLGEMTKVTVRSIAAERGFCTADKKDSQDICFIEGNDYGRFIEQYSGIKNVPGDFITADGNCVGTHKGIVNYTIGQRKGLGLAMNKHVFVIKKELESNRIIIGDEQALYTKRLRANNINLIATDKISGSLKVSAKTRYRQQEAAATVFQTGDDEITVEFDAPQRAVTKGQSVVLYDGDTVIGGGIIL